jgi:ribonuclease BN (tRNA processing enzyme)
VKVLTLMKVRILGTGTASPSLTRLSSSYVVSSCDGNILIDVGPSVVRRLLECNIALDDIDVIVLTHFHPDHTVDLVTLLFALNYGGRPRRKPLLLIGGPGLRTFHKKLLEAYPWIAPLEYTLLLKTMSKSRLSLKGINIITDRMKHNDESIGVRIESESKSTVFSGDTDYCSALTRLASNADLLIVECSFPEKKVEGHMNLPTLLPLIEKAKVGRTLLSHLYPEWDKFSSPLPAPFMLAEDGMEIDL